MSCSRRPPARPQHHHHPWGRGYRGRPLGLARVRERRRPPTGWAWSNGFNCQEYMPPVSRRPPRRSSPWQGTAAASCPNPCGVSLRGASRRRAPSPPCPSLLRGFPVPQRMGVAAECHW